MYLIIFIKMVRSCLLCTECYRGDNSVTFHIFPVDTNIRKQWFQAIGRQYQERKFIYLCSNHFSKDDFVIKFCGQRYLKKNALPVRGPSDQNERLERPPGPPRPRIIVAPVFGPPRTPTKRRKRRIEAIEEPPLPPTPCTISVDSPLKLSTVAVHPLSVTEKTESALQNSSRTFTVTVPECDIKPASSIKRKRFLRPRYIGDCDESDMQYSKRAITTWRAMRKIIDRQRNEISILQRRTRRMKHREARLTSLLAYIRSEFIIKKI